jgi:hypothetical protein
MDGPDDGIARPPTPPPALDYEHLADAFHARLWARDATRLGWIQMSRWSPLLKYYLGITGKDARRVFSLLYRRGHFLDRRLAVGRHPAYLFLQTPIPPEDGEARKQAIKYWRWHAHWSKGAHIPVNPNHFPSSPLATSAPHP